MTTQKQTIYNLRGEIYELKDSRSSWKILALFLGVCLFVMSIAALSVESDLNEELAECREQVPPLPSCGSLMKMDEWNFITEGFVNNIRCEAREDVGE